VATRCAGGRLARFGRDMQAGYTRTDRAPRAESIRVVRYCPAPPEPVWRSAETPSYIMPRRDAAGPCTGCRWARSGEAIFAYLTGSTARHTSSRRTSCSSSWRRATRQPEIRREILEEECRIESQLCSSPAQSAADGIREQVRPGAVRSSRPCAARRAPRWWRAGATPLVISRLSSDGHDTRRGAPDRLAHTRV